MLNKKYKNFVLTKLKWSYIDKECALHLRGSLVSAAVNKRISLIFKSSYSFKLYIPVIFYMDKIFALPNYPCNLMTDIKASYTDYSLHLIKKLLFIIYRVKE